jgi:hypothetical protein
VCEQDGIVLPHPPAEAVDEAIADAYDYQPSMLQDVLARHDCMVALVKGLEKSWSA